MNLLNDIPRPILRAPARIPRLPILLIRFPCFSVLRDRNILVTAGNRGVWSCTASVSRPTCSAMAVPVSIVKIIPYARRLVLTHRNIWKNARKWSKRWSSATRKRLNRTWCGIRLRRELICVDATVKRRGVWRNTVIVTRTGFAAVRTAGVW